MLSVLAVSYPATAAAESCAYNPATRAVTATIDPTGAATLQVTAAGEIWFGAVPAACGAATSANTDSIAIAGAAGSVESLTIDESAAFLGPGFSSESNIPEIETAVALGDAADVVVVARARPGTTRSPWAPTACRSTPTATST